MPAEYLIHLQYLLTPNCIMYRESCKYGVTAFFHYIEEWRNSGRFEGLLFHGERRSTPDVPGFAAAQGEGRVGMGYPGFWPRY